MTTAHTAHTPTEHKILTGEEAKAFGRDLAVSMGRPRIGEERGASPVVRTRVTRSMKDALARLVREEDVKEADLVREALEDLLRKRAAASKHHTV